MAPVPLASLIRSGCEVVGKQMKCPAEAMKEAAEAVLPSWLELVTAAPEETSTAPPTTAPSIPDQSLASPDLPDWLPWIIGAGGLIAVAFLAVLGGVLGRRCWRRLRVGAEERRAMPTPAVAFSNRLARSSSTPSLSSAGSGDDVLLGLQDLATMRVASDIGASSALRRRSNAF